MPTDFDISPRFPHPDVFPVGDRRVPAADVVEALRPFVSRARQERIDGVVARRTYTVATVIEGLYDLGNVHAVMRTAEGLGFAAFHMIEAGGTYKRSRRSSQGAEKWLDVARWPTPAACAAGLKRRGYRLAVTHLDAAVPVDTLDFSRPTALAFGNEAEGISDALLSLADARCIIPMNGFVQSFNISVAAALGLYHAYTDRLRSLGGSGDLSADEREILRAVYYRRSVAHADAILRRRCASVEQPS